MTPCWAAYRDGKLLYESTRGTRQEVLLWAVAICLPGVLVAFGKQEEALAAIGVKVVKARVYPAEPLEQISRPKLR